MSKFIPDDFNPPIKTRIGDFVIRQLRYDDAEVDYEAVMSSIDIINKTRNDSWPTKDLTLKENKIDLAWHQREFEYNGSFAYCVWDKDKKEYIGCIYFYPLDKPWVKAPNDSDVDISMWVTQKSYDKGLYPDLFKVLKVWIEKDWPFKQPFYSNKEIPA